MYNILKLKSGLKTVTKETARLFRIMIIGFILIITIFIIKYKPVYEVRLSNNIIGYVTDISKFSKQIDEQILNIEEKNIDNISLKEEPQYEFKLLKRNKETNDNEIIDILKQSVVITYKYYAVVLNDENKAYVETIKEATEIVEQIKSEHENEKVDLNLYISEVYTEKNNDINILDFEVAETSVKEEVNEFIESETAIAKIKGINISVLPVSGRITSRFGEISSIRSKIPHTGLDIACNSGTDIKAVAKGKVIYAGWSGDYGKIVKIDHGNGLQTWYAHCSKIYVSEGDDISYGDVISAVGSTGNSTGPHLHFEVRIDGIAVNPQDYINFNY